MNSDGRPPWLNDFLFWDAVVVAILIGLDFWIGKQARKQILKRARKLFVDFRNADLVPVYAATAGRWLVRLREMTGKPFSLRFFGRTFVVVAVPTALVLVAVSWWRRHRDSDFIQMYLERPDPYTWWNTGWTITGNVIAIYGTFLIALAASIRLLALTYRVLPTDRHRVRSPTDIRREFVRFGGVLGLAFANLALSFALIVAFLSIAVSVTTYPVPEFTSPVEVFARIVGSYRHYVLGERGVVKFFWTTGFFALLSVAPAMIHLGVSIGYVVGRLVSVAINWFLSRLFLRVSQGNESVLKQVTLVIGGIAALIERGVKALS